MGRPMGEARPNSFIMKTALALFIFLAASLASPAQTGTADDATTSGAKADPGINSPATVGPRPTPENPASGAIVTPTPGTIPSPSPSPTPSPSDGTAQ